MVVKSGEEDFLLLEQVQSSSHEPIAILLDFSAPSVMHLQEMSNTVQYSTFRLRRGDCVDESDDDSCVFAEHIQFIKHRVAH